MLIEVKQSEVRRVPVVLRDANGTPVKNIAAGKVVIYYSKDGGADTIWSATGNYWEISPTNMPGCFSLTFSAADLGTVGYYLFQMRVSGASNWEALISVVSNVEADTYNRLGTPEGADLASDLKVAMGLGFHNFVQRGIAYNGSGYMIAANYRLYNNPTNAQTDDGSTGLLRRYGITASYNATNQLTELKVTNG